LINSLLTACYRPEKLFYLVGWTNPKTVQSQTYICSNKGDTLIPVNKRVRGDYSMNQSCYLA